jgi:GDPmannose 4,6-dehydratase
LTKRAFVTGITGQDGSYLAELLLEKGYEVHGLVRRTSSVARSRVDPIREKAGDRLHLHYGDLTDAGRVMGLLNETEPEEVYNLGAQSHVRVSFDDPNYAVNVDAVGALNVLEGVRKMRNPAKFYQASSSEMYGKVHEVPQSETTVLHPRSPYACAKVYAHYQTINYREAYGLHACSGILFNHESPRRGETFVTRKITMAAARIKQGLQKKLFLGNLSAKRDWGFAGDYVEAMWLMLQQDEADDFVIATGETHSVEEFLIETFTYLDLDWHDFVEHDVRFERPSEVELLLGDASKAKAKLGWTPKCSFKSLVHMMVDADVEEVAREAS